MSTLKNKYENNGIKESKIDSINETVTRHAYIGIPTFRTILVAYDGMQMSKRALSYAVYISKLSSSEIVVIKVIKKSKDLGNTLPITVKVNLHKKEEKQIDFVESRPTVLQNGDLRELVEEMINACKAAGIDGTIIYKICSGNPANEIISLSNTMHFNLIIMGSRRIASRIQGIGSTTRKVAATLKIPLLIIQKQAKYKDEW